MRVRIVRAWYELTYQDGRPSGSVSKVAIGIGRGTVDAGGGTAEKSITHYIRLVYWQSLLQGWLSGSVLGVTIGTGEGIVDEGVGATGRRIKLGEGVHVSKCERGACIQWTKHAMLHICKA